MAHGNSNPQPRQVFNSAKKLLHAAALASSLVPLAAVAADAATINCISQGGVGSGGCFGVVGEYTPSGGATISNTWKFFLDFTEDQFGNKTFLDLVYTFEVRGVPEQEFALQVIDFITTQGGLLEGNALANFPDARCITTFDPQQCGLFDVFLNSGEVEWEDDLYEVIIRWLSSAEQPPDDGNNYILRAGDHATFDFQLETFLYDPFTDPVDPGLGGRGDQFSRFGAFRTDVPEPSLLLLLGTGVAGALYRKRRRRTA